METKIHKEGVITEPGFYTMEAKLYHADPTVEPSLSSSVGVDLITKSPAHVKEAHPRLSGKAKPDEATEAMGFGSVVHEILLGTGGGFAIWEEDTWRGNAARDFRESASAAGKTPIKRADYERADECCKAVRLKLGAMELAYVLTEGTSEHVAIWKEHGHFCRAMYDRHISDRREIWDIKTTGRGAHPEEIARTIARMNYDMRSQFYLRGAEMLTGIPAKKGGYGYCFLFIETEPPFEVVPCFLDESFTTRGKLNATHAILSWAQCMDSGKWPGYVSGPVEITAPGYVDFEIEEQPITSSGAQIV